MVDLRCRILSQHEPDPPELKSQVLTMLIDRAVQHADDEVLRAWLEVGEAHLLEA